jgi:hypothetical protein
MGPHDPATQAHMVLLIDAQRLLTTLFRSVNIPTSFLCLTTSRSSTLGIAGCPHDAFIDLTHLRPTASISADVRCRLFFSDRRIKRMSNAAWSAIWRMGVTTLTRDISVELDSPLTHGCWGTRREPQARLHWACADYRWADQRGLLGIDSRAARPRAATPDRPQAPLRDLVTYRLRRPVQQVTSITPGQRDA